MYARVLILDDEALFRHGLALIIRKKNPDWDVYEASDENEAVQKAALYHPQLILLNPILKRVNGNDGLAALCRLFHSMTVLLVSKQLTHDVIIEALSVGVKGFVLRSVPPVELLSAIETAMSGRVYLTAETLSGAYNHTYQIWKNVTGRKQTFTIREIEILQLMSRGHTSSSIAAKLNISRRTVERHRANMFSRHGIRSAMELIRVAEREGIIGRE
jgi:DNA-binding NarL/FixJ family response regulator